MFEAFILNKVFRSITFFIVLFVAISSQSLLAEDNSKTLLKGRYLKLEGGFKIPILNDLGSPNMRYSSLGIDKLPGKDLWAMGHPAGYVVELKEPDMLGTGEASSWPTLTLERSGRIFEDVDKISPEGVFWLNENTILTSGRKSYRSGFVDGWIGKVNLENQEKQLYTIRAPSNDESDNFHVLQALGAGFLRINSESWADALADGNEFLLGRGGYDVLGSPLGPALAAWNIGEPHASFLLDFPNEHPARRDPYYTYPSLAPVNLEDDGRLPIWKDPDSVDGFWQAGEVGGLTHINHPEVKGIIATHNFGRGILDYDAQGDGGSGKYFLVASPSIFYSVESGGGNRGDHESEVENSSYPSGVYGRVGLVIDPDDLLKVKSGLLKPWEVKMTRFEWPRAGINWAEDAKKPTALGGVYWDDSRQLLWVAMDWPFPILAAYSLVVDDSRPEEEVRLPVGLYNKPLPPENILVK